MARRQRHELVAPAGQERVGADDEPAGMELDEDCEGGVHLAFGASPQDMELEPLVARRFPHVSDYALGIRIARIHKQCNHAGLGNQLGHQLEPLRVQLAGEDAEAREVAPRSGETGDQAAPDRVGVAGEDDWDRRGPVFRRKRRRDAGCGDHVDVAADEGGGQFGQPPILPLRAKVFDPNVLPLDIAGFAQSPVEGGQKRCKRAERRAAEETDHRHRLLLRTERVCRRHRAAQHQQQFAAPHSMTSSARARMAGGIVRPSALAVLRLTTSSNLVGC
jgi:hypothetical protein